MVRKELQALSRTRLKEAKALLRAGLPDGAYYLAGYAVECALKACIAKTTRKHEFPDRDRVNKSYTHKLDELIKLAGLTDVHAALEKSNPRFGKNWGVVREWSEQSRYRRHDPRDASALVAAIMERRDGILSWLRHCW